MMEALHPSTLGEILDRTAHLYRSRFLVFFGIAVVPAGVILACAASAFLFFAWMGSGGAAAAGPAWVGVLSFLFLAVGALIVLPLGTAATALGSAALTHAASVEFLGERITIRAAYKGAWKRGWRYIGLFLLQTLFLVIVPVVVLTILLVAFATWMALSKSAGGSNDGQAALVLLLFAILGAYALWMLLRLCLAFPACLVEKLSAWAALKRAFSLSKDTRGRILVLYLLGAVLGWTLSMLLTIPVIVIVSLIPGMNSPQHAQTMGTIFLFTFYGASFATQALTRPVYAIALLVFYYDQRIRKEAFDIEWMMRQAGMIPPPEPESQGAPWMPPLPNKPAAPQILPGLVASANQAPAEATLTLPSPTLFAHLATEPLLIDFSRRVPHLESADAEPLRPGEPA